MIFNSGCFLLKYCLAWHEECEVLEFQGTSSPFIATGNRGWKTGDGE